jgi:hypothetical protein
VPAQLIDRPYYNIAIFWGSIARPLESLRPDEGHQHARLYVGTRDAPAAIVTTDYVRIGPAGGVRGAPAGPIAMSFPTAPGEFKYGAWMNESEIEIVEALGLNVRVPGTSRETQLIAEAEEEARTYPRGGGSGPGQLDPTRGTIQPTPGASERRCVDTTGTGAVGVRSGEIVAGNFGAYASLWEQRQAKVWWLPQFLPKAGTNVWPGLMTLRIRADRLDAIAPSVTAVYSSWARSNVPSGQGAFLLPGGPDLPTRGKWLLVARGGMNWGCFRLSF